ncbi:hypothetical protein SE17_23210 [Kouleothrix aurantiaca]|uniref:Uncharacterized protein n=1 Tax=Kouleothrix aurantiaca TaxID=186479 RepID=A0A0P9D768_9CHLR|nr:hypothetical protein SE17_23210 [Kouleothrix aurantiaca]
MAEPRQDAIRVAALAVHQLVDGALQAHAQRLEQHRHQAGRQQGHPHIALGVEQRAQVGHHHNVQAEDAGRQRAIHQRAIDQNVDIVQAVAQDGNAQRHRQK